MSMARDRKRRVKAEFERDAAKAEVLALKKRVTALEDEAKKAAEKVAA